MLNASEILGIRVFLSRAKSVFQRSGPNPVFRPRLPKVPNAFREKQEGLNHWVASPSNALGAHPGTRFGRPEKFCKKPVWSNPVMMVNGGPLAAVRSPLNCHPSTSLFPWKGRLYTLLTRSDWVRLKSEGARSWDSLKGFISVLEE